MQSALSGLALILLNFAEFTAASCAHGTSLLKREVVQHAGTGRTEKTVAIGTFGYIGDIGPANWASLAPENLVCATSKVQSPIDVTNASTTLVAPGTLEINLPTVSYAEFENLGTTIEVVMEGKNASIAADGKMFDLKQFHFHSPSEHTIDGEYFPLEMHMVHQAADESLAVIAILFQLSESCETTSLLTSVMESIDAITQPGSVTETGVLDFSALVSTLSEQSMHTYSGSLTTPPCAEGLTFYISSDQLPLDVTTYNKIKAVVGFNSRFPQNTQGEENVLTLNSQTLAAAGAVSVSKEQH